jgi:beta-hydroxylase
MHTAMFSILRGPKHLAPHRGPYRGFLRYHLGLKVPDVESCWIRVGNETRHWVEGESLLFDDTFEHEAQNATNEDRVVLFVDIERPLPPPLDRINRRVITALAGHTSIRTFLDRSAEWEQAHGRDLDRVVYADRHR